MHSAQVVSCVSLSESMTRANSQGYFSGARKNLQKTKAFIHVSLSGPFSRFVVL